MCRYIWVTDESGYDKTLVDLEKVEHVKAWPPTTVVFASGNSLRVRETTQWMSAKLNDYACWCRESKIDLSGVVEHLNDIRYELQGIRGAR